MASGEFNVLAVSKDPPMPCLVPNDSYYNLNVDTEGWPRLNGSRNSTTPPAMHNFPVSRTLVWKTTRFWSLALPSPEGAKLHDSVRSVWPGMTVSTNLTLMLRYMPYRWNSCFPAMPMEHIPCRIGTGKPACLLKSGSTCMAMRSPVSLYQAACSSEVLKSSTASGQRAGMAYVREDTVWKKKAVID